MPLRYGVGRVGRAMAVGVASESVAAGLDPAGGVGSDMTAVAGIRSALSSVRLATAKGPEPMGWCPNGSLARLPTAMPASRWDGAIGWVAAWRKPLNGVIRVITTVRWPSVLTWTSFHEPAPGPW